MSSISSTMYVLSSESSSSYKSGTCSASSPCATSPGAISPSSAGTMLMRLWVTYTSLLRCCIGFPVLPLYQNSSNSPANPVLSTASVICSSFGGGGGVSTAGTCNSSTTPGISAGVSGNAAGSGSSALSSMRGSCSSVQSKGVVVSNAESH